MKLDRRCFLALGAGSAGFAAGIAASPIPWKLIDDSSIWSQNWPWTPVPPDGEATYEKSACTLCPGGCGITVRRIDNRAVKIEGSEGHPVNNGGICALGLSGSQLLYGPTRIKSPMKKVNGKLEPISWHKAITELAEKLGKIRENGNTDSLACITESDQGTVSGLFSRFLTAFGSPNFICTPSSADTAKLAAKKTLGAYTNPVFDFENSDYVLSFGAGLLDGWGSPARMFRANGKWSKLVQVEPRLSNTAAKADKWIPIKPGTEADLALGIAHVIIAKNLYNSVAVHSSTAGFEDMKRLCEKHTPEKVEKITHVKAAVIKMIAKDFIDSRHRAVAVYGKGQGNTPGSIKEVMAVQALNALAGSINKKGGMFTAGAADYISWPAVDMDNAAAKGIRKNRLDGAGSKFPDALHLLNRLPKVINSAKKSPIEVLFVYAANPLHSMCDSEAVKKTFDKIPFVVSFSSYEDETAKHADLVLPNHTYLERYEDVSSISGVRQSVISLARPVVAPQLDTMHSGDVILHLAEKIGGSVKRAFPWKSYEACLKKTMGSKWSILKKNGFLTVAASPASSGKFRFTPLTECSDAGISAEGDGPLTLIPKDSMRISSGYIGSTPYMIKTVPDTVLEYNKRKKVCYGQVDINPETAAEIQLQDDCIAEIITPKGIGRLMILDESNSVSDSGTD